jgi:hypothetical protein
MSKTGAIEKIDGITANLMATYAESKLTVSEIADYIAAKAEELINQELAEVQKKMNLIFGKVGAHSNGPLDYIPKSLSKVVPSIELVIPGTEIDIYFRQSEIFDGKYEYELVAEKPPIESLCMKIRVPDDEIPKEVWEYQELAKQNQLLISKLQEIKRKKYRVALIEKILHETDKG